MIGDTPGTGFSVRLFPGGIVSSREVMRLVSDLATNLARQGVRPRSAVSIEGIDPLSCMVGMLAAWRNGCAVVPVHPATPQVRADFMRHAVAVTHRLVTPTRRLDVNSYVIMPAEPSPDMYMADGILPDGIAYILFTSGSTGLPKGVLVSHRALERRLKGFAEHVGLDQSSMIATLTPPIFDISLAETLLPLLIGCGLVAPAPGPRILTELVRWLPESGATVVQGTPTLLQVLRAAGWAPTTRQTIWSAGEALPGPLATWVGERAGELWNLYGPTEAVIYATAWRYSVTQSTSVMPIGTWLPGTCGTLRQVAGAPDAQSGELCIGGEIIAEGYIGANGLIPLPVVDVDGEDLYPSGDLCSFSEDGAYRYLGRLDDQVKVRGHRIELGEVESVALQVSGVEQAVAFTMASGGMDSGKLAIAITGTVIDVGYFKQQLRTLLPEYMVPAAVFVRSYLPVTASGKIDRRKVATEMNAL